MTTKCSATPATTISCPMSTINDIKAELRACMNGIASVVKNADSPIVKVEE